MDDATFSFILPECAAQTIQAIMERTGWDEDKTINSFMRSKVYDRLSIEESKTWHLSYLELAKLFFDEEKGDLQWPASP